MRLALLPMALLLVLPAPGEAQQRSSTAMPVACADFHGHVNHAWLLANPLSPGQDSRSRLDELSLQAQSATRTMLEQATRSPAGEIDMVLGTFWAAATNAGAMDAGGTAALAEALAPLDRLRRGRDLPKVSAAFHALGLSPLVELVQVQDAAGKATLAVAPAPLGLGDPRFYTGSENELRQLLGQYRAYVERLLRAAGTAEAELSAASEAVLQIEIALAQAMAANADGRDTAPVRDLDRRHAAVGLADLMKALGAANRELVLLNPPYFAALAQLAQQMTPAQWQAFLRFRVINTLAPWLAQPLREAHGTFHAVTLGGQPAAPSTEAHAQDVLRRRLGALLDSAYTARHVPAERRAQAEALAAQIQQAAVARVGADNAAREALAAVQWRIAPDAALPADLPNFRADAAAANWRALNRWHEQRLVAGDTLVIAPVAANVPVIRLADDRRTLWVSAAALAEPAYAGRNDATDIARLGVLLGHELSKAVPAGTRGAGLAAVYSGFPIAPGVRVDGARTQAMNLADAAGLAFAWQAFSTAQPTADANAKKAFFRAYAELWARQDSPAALSRQGRESPWAPAPWRVNGPLSQFPPFGALYGCRIGAVMRAARPVETW